MKTLLLTASCLAALASLSHEARAQKEAIGMFYELQMAPAACKWTNAGDKSKLDATIAAQEKGLAVTPAEKADLTAKAAADIKSDPSNCAPDGMLRAMYDEAIK